MIKKIINILFILLIVSACSKEFNETLLLVPPNFNKIPDAVDKNNNKINKMDKKEENFITKKDLIDIKKLLLE
jgi:hypothetical protein|tara:strand:- start:97 stop:315 length:219 start_codon:yes stop_codon:yes gene_type:complete